MNFKFKFIEKHNFWILISALVILPGFISMGIKLVNSDPILNYGIDFIGGNTFNIQLESPPINEQQTSDAIRTTLKSFSLDNSYIQFSNNNEIYIKTL